MFRNWRRSFAKLGGDMLGVGWARYFAVATACAVAGAAIFAVGSASAKILPDLVPLLEYSVLVAVATVILAVFFKVLLSVVGTILERLSRYYPEWLYRPKCIYSVKANHENILHLYIKSSRRNKQAQLVLDFAGLRLQYADDNQKHQIEQDSINARGKRLYETSLTGKELVAFPISINHIDGKRYLEVPGSYYLLHLYPGKRHYYEFHESGYHRGVSFWGRLRTVEFVLNDKGEFEV